MGIVRRIQVQRTMSRSLTSAAVAMLLAACSSASEVSELTSLTPNAAHALSITLPKTSWTWDEVSQGPGLRAAIRNTTTRAIKSSLGDAFNAASEQPNLFLAELAGGGAVEWRDASGAWEPVALAILVEGAKAVTLRPGTDYSLTAHLAGARRTGTFRIRIDFYDDPAGSERQSDYSAPFEVR